MVAVGKVSLRSESLYYSPEDKAKPCHAQQPCSSPPKSRFHLLSNCWVFVHGTTFPAGIAQLINSAPANPASAASFCASSKPKFRNLPALSRNAFAPVDPNAWGRPPFPARFRDMMSDVRLPAVSADPAPRLAALRKSPASGPSKNKPVIPLPVTKLVFSVMLLLVPVATFIVSSVAPPML